MLCMVGQRWSACVSSDAVFNVELPLGSLPFLFLVSGSRAILMEGGCSLIMRSGRRPVCAWWDMGHMRVVRDEMTCGEQQHNVKSLDYTHLQKSCSC